MPTVDFANQDLGALVAALSLEEKASLCSGADFWHTAAIEGHDIPSILVADGPHGLRIQIAGGDHLGLDASVPATCFPPAVTLASTWNTTLVGRIGDAIGAEARANGVSVVLGPGINIKRSPLCGRNFEYYSEDPLVAGELGTAWVLGVQLRGIGASLKHFAVNNQETDRLRVSAEVDDRTLREIYLAPFERVVRQAAPWTVMCSYNRINGVYAAHDPWLLTTVLRDEWGFDGLVVSDWGAVSNPVASVQAGLDLEMPATSGMSAQKIVAAVQAGDLLGADLDRAVGRVLALVQRAQESLVAPVTFSATTHHALAREAAAEGVVLLRNDNHALPLSLTAGQRVAVIGEFARTPRYQGAGSSQVNPTQVDDALGALRDALGEGVTVDFAAGYVVPGETDARGETATSGDGTANVDATTLAPDPGVSLRDEAIACARGADAVVVFLGLPAVEESEGFDRKHIALPQVQTDLLAAIADVVGPVIVVLANGGVVTTAAIEAHAAAIVEGWLGGQAGGGGVADVLTGAVCPSGKLAETIPVRLEDTPTFHNFPGEDRVVRYGEGQFVGYRHYDAIDAPVAYPFGHGLSYTTFDYRDLTTIALPNFGGDDVIEVGATIRNTGDVAGAEVVQLYVAAPESSVVRPVRELKGFTKVFLAPGESTMVTFRLSRRDLSVWSPRMYDWVFESGRYDVFVSASSRDHRLFGVVDVGGNPPAFPLDTESTLHEWLEHPIGSVVLDDMLTNSPAGDFAFLINDATTLRMIGPFPLLRLLAMTGGIYGEADLNAALARVEEQSQAMDDPGSDPMQTGWESDRPEDRPR